MAGNGIDASYYTVIDLAKMTQFYEKIYMADGKTGGRSGSVQFAVDDVKAMAKRAEEAGAKIDGDPEGNQFILHKRKN